VRVLVSAASRHDATREIAEAPAAGLAKRGVDADARPLGQITRLDRFDTVVLESAIYMGRWLKSAREFVSEHAAELSSIQMWLLRCGPLGPPDHLIPPGESAAPAASARPSTHQPVLPGRSHGGGISVIARGELP
jgi:menaquinone-dependent protoporphyrinogen oxidase